MILHKAIKILGASVVVIALAAGGAYFWLSQPVPLEHFEENVPLETRQRNSDVQTALLVMGIESSLVDINAERAYIAYDLPADSPYDSDKLQAYALGVAAAIAPESQKGIIVQYVDEKAALAWEGDLAGARAVQDGTMDEAAYLASVKKTTL
jgi:hypothetical protein